MTVEALQNILKSNKTLSINEIKQIIYELKADCLAWSYDETENKYKHGYYAGEVNAFYICLDLLDKFTMDFDDMKRSLWSIVRRESIEITNQNVDWLLERAYKEVL